MSMSPPPIEALPPNERIGRLLRAARDLGGFTNVRDLATALDEPGLGYKTLLLIEQGRRRATPEELRRIATACSLHESFFYRSHSDAMDGTHWRLRTARELRGMTQEELSSRLADLAKSIPPPRTSAASFDYEVSTRAFLERLREWEDPPEDRYPVRPVPYERRLLNTALDLHTGVLSPITPAMETDAQIRLQDLKDHLAQRDHELARRNAALEEALSQARADLSRTMRLAESAMAVAAAPSAGPTPADLLSPEDAVEYRTEIDQIARARRQILAAQLLIEAAEAAPPSPKRDDAVEVFDRERRHWQEEYDRLVHDLLGPGGRTALIAEMLRAALGDEGHGPRALEAQLPTIRRLADEAAAAEGGRRQARA